jgi:epoxyqueuosine reductase QueG
MSKFYNPNKHLDLKDKVKGLTALSIIFNILSAEFLKYSDLKPRKFYVTLNSNEYGNYFFEMGFMVEDGGTTASQREIETVIRDVVNQVMKYVPFRMSAAIHTSNQDYKVWFDIARSKRRCHKLIRGHLEGQVSGNIHYKLSEKKISHKKKQHQERPYHYNFA